MKTKLMIGDVLQGGHKYDPLLWRVVGVNEDENQIAMKRLSHHGVEAKRINYSISQAERFVFVGVYRPLWKSLLKLSFKRYESACEYS